MARILIIEDEKNLSRFVELELQHEGYKTRVELDGRKGLDAALSDDWDVILLDLMLPTLNGLEVCRRIRQEKSTPIIMMTARDSVIDRVSGLDHGADDYIIKPFAIEELLARLRSLLRRIDIEDQKMAPHSTKIEYRDLVMDKEAHTLSRDGKIIELTRREYDLFLTLLNNMGKVLSREQLLKSVWSSDATQSETNIVDVYVRYLRNKIDLPDKESYIQTVRGTGYVVRP